MRPTLTYEELFVFVANKAKSLPGCGLQLLVHLIGCAIEDGTNEVNISARNLATEVGISRDAVKVASRSLAHLIEISGSPGISSKFVMPADWFSPQRSLFAASSPVQNLPPMAWKPGHQWTRNQAINGLETRPRWTENQAIMAW